MRFVRLLDDVILETLGYKGAELTHRRQIFTISAGDEIYGLTATFYLLKCTPKVAVAGADCMPTSPPPCSHCIYYLSSGSCDYIDITNYLYNLPPSVMPQYEVHSCVVVKHHQHGHSISGRRHIIFNNDH